MDRILKLYSPDLASLRTLPYLSAADAERAFWRNHGWWPLLGFVVCLGALEIFSLDRVFARDWFFDVHSGQWLGSGSGDWWAHRLLHGVGRWLVRGVAALVLTAWLLSFFDARARQWRRPAGFMALAMLASVILVGGLKTLTNVDCPWDLAGFGGHNPYVALFADRPDNLPRARCFPGAHSSSGFALVCIYFVLRQRAHRLTCWALAGAILIGVAFSLGQEARGAHFLSHDLTSAALVWFAQLGMYRVYARASAPSGRCELPSTKSNRPVSAGVLSSET
jgi:membrane-associated PAP2 superfamily phosphatase